VAGPAGLAARRAPAPVLTEPTAAWGSPTACWPGARRVCLAFPIPGRDGGRYLVTGAPPAAILAADRDRARRRFQIAPDDRSSSCSVAARAPADQPLRA
jgi:UDP-N-acetylglucosamine--N-acetylmuramyl-(pentapeptide) pyrophosphoryl-undecaprenol N-acetylglucosamine transferase